MQHEHEPQQSQNSPQPSDAPSSKSSLGSWLRRLFRSMPAETYELTDEGIMRHLGAGGREAVRWADIEKVEIETTDGGPYVEDVFWLLWGKADAAPGSRGVVVPNSRVTELALLDWLKRLPGFEAMEVSRGIVTAMGSTRQACFEVWRRSA